MEDNKQYKEPDESILIHGLKTILTKLDAMHQQQLDINTRLSKIEAQLTKQGKRLNDLTEKQGKIITTLQSIHNTHDFFAYIAQTASKQSNTPATAEQRDTGNLLTPIDIAKDMHLTIDAVRRNKDIPWVSYKGKLYIQREAWEAWKATHLTPKVTQK